MTAPDSPGGRHSDGAPGAVDAELEMSGRAEGDELEVSRGAVREFADLVAQGLSDAVGGEFADVVVRRFVDVDFWRYVDVYTREYDNFEQHVG